MEIYQKQWFLHNNYSYNKSNRIDLIWNKSLVVHYKKEKRWFYAATKYFKCETGEAKGKSDQKGVLVDLAACSYIFYLYMKRCKESIMTHISAFIFNLM
jgi:hypothetical protein